MAGPNGPQARHGPDWPVVAYRRWTWLGCGVGLAGRICSAVTMAGSQERDAVMADLLDAPGRRFTRSPGVPLRDLPSWPFTLMLAGFPLWWLSGLGEIAWVVLAVPMVIYLLRRGSTHVPRGFGVWAMFLVWMCFSVVGIDSSGRLIGFIYRVCLYAVVTIVFIYVYNARRSISTAYVVNMFAAFLAWATIGGILGLLYPLFEFRTPLAYLLPSSLTSNELVQEMVVRRTTQFNPNSWVVIPPRPSAPFLYTNGWGNVYSVVAPIVAVSLVGKRRPTARIGLIVLVVTSLIPAVLSLNRGMFIGIGVLVGYVFIRLVLQGNGKAVATIVLASSLVLGAALALDVQSRLDYRLETSSSTQDRSNLYGETFERTLASPLFGYGAPRPSETAGAPSAGTQGQFWSVMFSHGFPGLAFFMAWLAWTFVSTIRVRGPGMLILNATLLVTMVESLYYGLLPDGLLLSMTVSGLLMRPRAVSADPSQLALQT